MMSRPAWISLAVAAVMLTACGPKRGTAAAGDTTGSTQSSPATGTMGTGQGTTGAATSGTGTTGSAATGTGTTSPTGAATTSDSARRDSTQAPPK
jgi:hypothetical protein